jgi:transposase
MGRAEVLQGVRQMRFEGLLERHERGELSQGEAAEMLGVSERTFRRWRDRLRDEGPAGLRDRRIGKPSGRRAAVEEILRMLGLYEERYSGFTVKHFHEQLHKRHHYKLGYTVTRLALQGAGLVRPAPRRSAHRKKRPRRPMVGMMLYQDASRFAWLPGDDRQYDLVVTLDDVPAGCATSCASRRNAGSATTTPSNGALSPCRSRRARSGRILCAPPCACTNTPTGAWQPFTGHIGWPITIPRESCATARNWLREPLRQPACGFVDNATHCPQPHRPNHNRSGQLMRLQRPVNLARQQQE